MSNTVHKFEAAGLGTAPYRLIRVQIMVGPITRPDGSQIGAPGQPMGTCQFCGTGIKDAFFLRSTDGKEFYVGSSCINKADDKGLMKVVSDHERAKRREKAELRRKKDQEFGFKVQQELGAVISRPEVREALRGQPHPKIPGMTRLDYAEFIHDRAGLVGRSSLLKTLKGEFNA